MRESHERIVKEFLDYLSIKNRSNWKIIGYMAGIEYCHREYGEKVDTYNPLIYLSVLNNIHRRIEHTRERDYNYNMEDLICDFLQSHGFDYYKKRYDHIYDKVMKEIENRDEFLPYWLKDQYRIMKDNSKRQAEGIWAIVLIVIIVAIIISLSEAI